MTPTMTPAESSPAIVHSTIEVPRSGEARETWLKTGSLPPSKAESTPAKEVESKGEQPEESVTTAPEAGKKQEPKRSTAEARLNELLDDLREAGLTPKALKSFQAEYERKQQRQDAPEKAPEKTENRVKAGGLQAPVKPKPEDFEGKTWAEYEEARDQYFEDLAEFKAKKQVSDYQELLRQEATTKELRESLSKAKERYGEEAQDTISVASQKIFEDSKISGVVKEMLNGSPVLVDVLYAIGKDGLDDFLNESRGNPGAAIRKLVLVEKFVMEELAGPGAKQETVARSEDGKFQSAQDKKQTSAPPPPREVGGRTPAPPDEVESAVRSVLNGGDARNAIEAMNRAMIRKHRGI